MCVYCVGNNITFNCKWPIRVAKKTMATATKWLKFCTWRLSCEVTAIKLVSVAQRQSSSNTMDTQLMGTFVVLSAVDTERN